MRSVCTLCASSRVLVFVLHKAPDEDFILEAARAFLTNKVDRGSCSARMLVDCHACADHKELDCVGAEASMFTQGGLIDSPGLL